MKSHSISNLNTNDMFNTIKNVNININKNSINNPINSYLKSNTYDSVCSPEDTEERNKQTNNNSIIRNNWNKSQSDYRKLENPSSTTLFETPTGTLILS